MSTMLCYQYQNIDIFLYPPDELHVEGEVEVPVEEGLLVADGPQEEATEDPAAANPKGKRRNRFLFNRRRPRT